ncbi:MAG: lipid II:glycine glycyltransferase FemX [Ignavibacterium sp.]
MIVAKDKDEITGSLLAVCIREGKGVKGYFSRRCIVWGGPLVKKDEPHIVDELLNTLNRIISSRTIYTEFRNLFDMSSLQNVFLKAGYAFEERINYIVEIESVEENRKNLNVNRRRQINKSIKSGAIIIEPENLQQIKQFYSLLKDLYKTKVKKPFPSFDLFKKFYELKENGKYLFVAYNGKIIGGIMCPVFKDTIYEWYVCGLDSEFREQSPSVMATWAAIEYAANNGLKYFDFMGAGKPNENYGVREFKSKFGGKEVRFGRYLRINNKLLYNAGKLGLKILK